ncbi:hypothetical protein WCP94_002612 [Bilophila wadsworthia]
MTGIFYRCFVKKGESAGLESRMKGIFLSRYFRIFIISPYNH